MHWRMAAIYRRRPMRLNLLKSNAVGVKHERDTSLDLDITFVL
jgi:hypothetical protein